MISRGRNTVNLANNLFMLYDYSIQKGTGHAPLDLSPFRIFLMENQYSYQYLFVSVFLIAALVFGITPIALSYLIAPKKPNKLKNASYECGLEAKGDAWIQFKVQYYVYALVFVLFDIETIFIYPWAVAFKQMGLFAFVEMVIFIGILIVGLAYAWKKKALEWE